MISLNSINGYFKDKDYFGWKPTEVFHSLDHYGYEIRFTKVVNKEILVFRMTLTGAFIAAAEPNEIIEHIEKQIYTIPDLKKAAHDQKFMNKFDKMLKDGT